jgi:hypothetical protein
MKSICTSVICTSVTIYVAFKFFKAALVLINLIQVINFFLRN